MNAETLWNACKAVLDKEKQPLDISRVSEACGLPGEMVIETLIKHAHSGRCVEFRYPPLPCAAITKLLP